MILPKAPPPPSDNHPVVSQKDDGAYAPRLYRLHLAPLYRPVDDEGRAPWEYGAKSNEGATVGTSAGPREHQGQATIARSELACEE
jgi:hypothetical protein